MNFFYYFHMQNLQLFLISYYTLYIVIKKEKKLNDDF